MSPFEAGICVSFTAVSWVRSNPCPTGDQAFFSNQLNLCTFAVRSGVYGNGGEREAAPTLEELTVRRGGRGGGLRASTLRAVPAARDLGRDARNVKSGFSQRPGPALGGHAGEHVQGPLRCWV